MLGAAVIPECNRVRAPPEAARPLVTADMAIEKFQECVAFAAGEFIDVAGEIPIDEDAAPPAFGVTDDDGMR